MVWRIHKTFEFCYGHRVWTQKLDKEFAMDTNCKCRHLHGHEGKVLVHLTGEVDEATSMLTDFRHLEWFKVFLDKNVDHRFILDLHDPLADEMVSGRALVPVYVPGTEYIAGWTLDLEGVEPGTPDYEYLEGFFVVDFVPTSEKLSQWAHQICQAKMIRLGVMVDKIEWWETPKSCSVYELGEKEKVVALAIVAGERDILAGRTYTHEEVKERLSKYFSPTGPITLN